MNSEPFGRSTPYTEKKVLVIYILLFVAVAVCTVVFTVKGTMDALQIALSIATFVCIFGGLYRHYVNSHTEVLLYDDCLMVGKKRISYGDILKVECARGVQLQIDTGRAAKDKHTALVGNGDALKYLINRKRKEHRKKNK